MIKIVFLLSLVQATAVVQDDQPYCALRYRRLCQGKGRHVACQFPAPGQGMSCRNYTQIKFTSDLRHFIIHYINRRRQRIASGNERVRGGARLPRPEIMMLVGWDRELAQLAQRLADQCHFVHDDCRATGTVWGHFSQLAVWTLRAVGCGAVRHGSEYTRMLLVCDFSHTNMLGQRTITPGSLAPCPMHTVRRSKTAYPLLCAPVRKPVLLENNDKNHGKESYDYDYDADDEEEDDNEEYTTRTVKQTQEIMRARFKETFSLMSNNRKTTRRVMNKFEHEMENGSNEQVTPRRYHQWEMRQSDFDRLRDGSDGRQYEKHSQKNLGTSEDEKSNVQEDDNHVTAREFITNHGQNLRHRWKQTRVRPRRPGANALLKKPPEKMLRRSSLTSFMLDQDDSDQLFRDTGFNAYWRKQPLPQ